MQFSGWHYLSSMQCNGFIILLKEPFKIHQEENFVLTFIIPSGHTFLDSFDYCFKFSIKIEDFALSYGFFNNHMACQSLTYIYFNSEEQKKVFNFKTFSLKSSRKLLYHRTSKFVQVTPFFKIQVSYTPGSSGNPF